MSVARTGERTQTVIEIESLFTTQKSLIKINGRANITVKRYVNIYSS